MQAIRYLHAAIGSEVELTLYVDFYAGCTNELAGKIIDTLNSEPLDGLLSGFADELFDKLRKHFCNHSGGKM